MIDCDGALADIEAYLDGELADEAQVRLEEHLSTCSPCFQRGEFRRRVRDIVRRKCGIAVDLPPSVAARIRAVIGSSED